MTMDLFGITILKNLFYLKIVTLECAFWKHNFYDQYCQYCILSSLFYIQKSQFDYEKKILNTPWDHGNVEIS